MALLRSRVIAVMTLLVFAATVLAPLVPAQAAARPTPQGHAMVADGANGGGMTCPGCKGDGGAKAMTACIAGGLCAIAPAILPQAGIVQPVAPVIFSIAALTTGHGIAVRPNPGPPRTTVHS